jgi:hypothetical protein
MTSPLSFELVTLEHFAGNTNWVPYNLTLTAEPSSLRGVYVRHPKDGGIAMDPNDSPALQEIRAYLAAVRSGEVAPETPRRGMIEETFTGTRADGRDVLEAAICAVDGRRYGCGQWLTDTALKFLHNERPGINSYPLSVNDGLFFSEAVGPKNDQADAYHDLVSKTLSLIGGKLGTGGAMNFECLDRVGVEIQKLDAAFARTKINQPQDRMHRCYGPSPQHPYSKITLCRTVVPISLGGDVVPFIYEKFLVAYSYLDGDVRLTTTTPLHSHPLNFETVYFTSYGQNSFVTEQEFHIVGKNGRPLISEEGAVDAELLSDIVFNQFNDITLRRGETHYIYPAEEPTVLLPFDPDASLADAGLIRHTDGLFRPHQVTVHDDQDQPGETLYYAIDNYFGPVGRVLIYNADGKPNLWSHDDWER